MATDQGSAVSRQRPEPADPPIVASDTEVLFGYEGNFEPIGTLAELYGEQGPAKLPDCIRLVTRDGDVVSYAYEGAFHASR